MKILYYDCFSGISGDMNLGAMVNLGVDSGYLKNELLKLKLEGYSLEFIADQRKGITGTRAIVNLTQTHQHHSTEKITANNIPLKFNTGSFQINKTPGNEHGRNFKEIKGLISGSSLNDNIKKLSIEIFTRVATAEGKIHGMEPDNVHFHEVGAVDSIVDIVGAAICIDFLKPDKIFCSTIELGGGTVKCAHGTFPVPAPATAEILKNIPVKLGAVNVETTTPTGAAILAALANTFTDKPEFTILKTAYGIGCRDTSIPNVLRVFWAESMDYNTDIEIAHADLIECNIDDMNPEQYGIIMDMLFEAGADDVYLQPIIMKKSRPAITLSVLCKKEISEKIENLILKQTTTLGIRKHTVEKKMLKRTWETIETPWGKVRVKYGLLNNKIIKYKPEYDDIADIAKKNNISANDVYETVRQLLISKK